MKTVTLPRGTLSTSSPPARPHLNTRVSNEQYLSGANRVESPGVVEDGDTLHTLGKIGITELLEQDERPTFIVDLGDATNFTASALRIVFANLALRSISGLLTSVTGTAESPSVTHTFPAFKAWLLGAVANGESLDVCLPSFLQGAFTWSCSTLRKRYRIAAATLVVPPPSTPLAPPYADARRTSPRMTGQRPERRHHVLSASNTPCKEPQDYFGDATTATAALPSQSILPSIEPNETSTALSSAHSLAVKHAPIFSNSDPSRASSKSPSTNGSMEIAQMMSASDIKRYVRRASENEVGFFDWTRLPNSAELPEHIRFARSVDWEATALGPISGWSADLRQMCNLIMASPHPAAMYWGEEMVAIYNEAYVLLAGQKHPKLMGQSYREAWSEIWEDVKDVFANARMTGQATMKDDDCLFIKRNDFLEETYFSWSIIPMVGGDGSVMGLYNPAFEKTRRKIAERRMLTLREVGERTAAARDIKGFWDEVLGALECNDLDTPFALLYSIGDDNGSESSSVHSSSYLGAKQCYLEGALGVPEGHMAAPDVVDLATGMEGFIPMFREVSKTNTPQVLDVDLGQIPAALIQDLEWRGFGDPVKAVVICPIQATTRDTSLGFLILGVNPRRPYDGDVSHCPSEL